jgi:hypothetical protein
VLTGAHFEATLKTSVSRREKMSDITATPPAPQTAPQEDKYTPVMVEHLKNTRPWVLFLAIMMIVGCGFLVIAGLFVLLSGALMGIASRAYDFGDLNMGAVLGLIGVFYLFLPAIYVAPIIFLFKFASSVSQLVKAGGAQHMETALRYQKTFWKYMGILTIVMIGVAIFAVIIGIVVAFAAVSRMYL